MNKGQQNLEFANMLCIKMPISLKVIAAKFFHCVDESGTLKSWTSARIFEG